jgi:hypothetical protein
MAKKAAKGAKKKAAKKRNFFRRLSRGARWSTPFLCTPAGSHREADYRDSRRR